MIFNELLYPVYLFFSVLIFHKISPKWKPWCLFISGVLFYGYYAEAFLWLIGLEVMLIYLLVPTIQKDRKALAAGLGIPIVSLAYFKYKNMFMITLAETTAHLGFKNSQPFHLDQIILPLAISFFTFEFLHYVIDARKGDIPKHSIEDFLSFIMFFPTMIAGPIKRFQYFFPQVRQAQLSYADINCGVNRILVGFAKKMIVADSLDIWVQPLLSDAARAGATPVDLWIALLAYSIRIYADFSAYSDIAIGSARLFGIVVPENFRLPYLKRNIGLFWRNWHISLTSWIIDYVYIPLGGSRRSLRRTCANILIAMLVSGLWHGAAWHFVFWGLYHGVLLSIHRFYSVRLAPRIIPLTKGTIVKGFSTLMTFAAVTIGWGLFILPAKDFFLILPRLVGLKGG